MLLFHYLELIFFALKNEFDVKLLQLLYGADIKELASKSNVFSHFLF